MSLAESVNENIGSVGFELFQCGEYAAAIRVFRNEIVRLPEAAGIWKTMVRICQERIRLEQIDREFVHGRRVRRPPAFE